MDYALLSLPVTLRANSEIKMCISSSSSFLFDNDYYSYYSFLIFYHPK